MPAETTVAGRIEAVAIPRDQRDALREGNRQVGADAGEAVAGQVMTLDVVNPRVVAQELEVDAVLAGPDRKPVRKVHEREASREDLLDVVAVEHEGKFGAQAEAAAHAKRGKRVGVLGDARV